MLDGTIEGSLQGYGHVQLLWVFLVLFLWLVVLITLEFLWPERTGRRQRWQHIVSNQLFTFSSVGVLVVLLALVFGTSFNTLSKTGLFSSLPFNLPVPVQLLLLIVAVDLYYYGMHRASHRFQWMWRVHRTHHSDPKVDATSTYRTHAIEFAWLFGGKSLIAIGLGVNPVYALAYDVLVGLLGSYYHSNIRVIESLDRCVRTVFVTQRWHLSHHSSDIRYTNMNYCTFFTFWDRLFGTARMAPDPAKICFGITQLDGAQWQSFTGLWTTPFRNPARQDVP